MNPLDVIAAFGSAIILALILLAALIHNWRLGDKLARAEAAAKWRKIHVEPAGRGPNADLWYWVPPPHQGHAVHFTDEALIAAKVSANRNLQHPHTFTS